MKLLILFIFTLSVIQSYSSNESKKLVENLKTFREDSSKVLAYEKIVEILVVKDRDYTLAMDYIYQGLKVANEINYEIGEARLFDVKGTIFRNSSQYDSSLYYHNLALEIANKLNNQSLKIICNNNIGVVYRRKDEFHTALSYHLKALKIAESINDEKSIAIAENGIGNIYISIKNFNNAINCFDRALKLEKKLGNRHGMAINYNNIGAIYEELMQYDKALDYYNQSLNINIEMNKDKGIAINYNSLGSVYKKMGKYDKALEYYENALKLDLKHNDSIYTSGSYINIGEIYNLLGNSSKALENLRIGLNLAEKVGSKYQIQIGLENLSKVYANKGDYKRALESYQSSALQKDSILNERNNKQILDLQQKYNFSKKEVQIKLLQKDKKNQFIIIIAFIIGIFLLFIILFVLWNNNKIKKNANQTLKAQSDLIEKSNLELKEVNSKLKILNATKDKFFSLIAHDLKNPLTAIILKSEIVYNYFEKLSDDEKIQSIKKLHFSAKHLFQLLENLLTWARAQSGHLEFNLEKIDLNSIISNNTKLFEDMAISKDINLIYKNEMQLMINADFNMLNTIIRNLLSNAIKFTLSGGIIEVGVIAKSKEEVYENQKIIIFVKDTGVGMSEDILQKLFHIDQNITYSGTSGEKGTGLGLILCKEFVEMHGGNIWVESQVGVGSTFYFSLPIEY